MSDPDVVTTDVGSTDVSSIDVGRTDVVTTDVGASDAEVIAASLGDPDRFAEIFDRYWPAISGYCLSRVGQPGEDVAAEVFRIAFTERARYDLDRASCRGWLFGIAANLLRRHHRSAARRARAMWRIGNRAGNETPPEQRMLDQVAAAMARGPLSEAVMGLREVDREIVLLHAWADLTYQEIADAIHVPIGTVRSRLNRARRVLRSRLEDHR